MVAKSPQNVRDTKGGEHNAGQLVHQQFLVFQSSTSVMISPRN